MVTKKETPEVDPWEDKAEVPANEYFKYTGAPDREFLTVTLKAGTGFDSPWLVFHANSVEEALASLKHDDLEELMDLTARKGKELAKAYSGSQGFSKPSGGTSTGYSAPSVSAGAVEWDPDSEDYVCNHGSATQRKGESTKGPWTGYFCPEPKGSPNQCAPKFLNKKR